MKILLKLDFKINNPHKEGYQLLHDCVSSPQFNEILKLLYTSNNVNLEVSNNFHKTPISWPIYDNNF